MSIPGTSTVEVPVLIVGAGPAGLALSAALSRYGVGHLLVERHRGTAHTPRAHIINQRTVEILRHLGISDRFHAVATPQHLMANNLWVTTLAGLEVARSETWGTSAERAADYRAASPEPMANCPQTVLEPMLLAAARDMGADIRFGTPVTRFALSPAGDGAIAHTDSGTFTAPVIAVAAGAWLAPLLDGAVGLPPLTVTQQQAFHFAPVPTPGPAAPADPWPIFVHKDGTNDCYGLPGGPDGQVPGAIKIGEHGGYRTTTAADRDFVVDPAARARVAGFVAARIPGLTTITVNEVSCLYTWTANEDFILDRRGPFVIASPCSGHGAKFAPLLGEIITDLATGKPAPDPRFTLAAHGVTRA